MNNKQKGYFLVLGFSIFWGFSIFFNKIGLLKGINPLVLSTQVFFFTAIILFMYLIFSGVKYSHIKKISKKNWKTLILCGIIGSGLGNVFGFIGLQMSTSINFGFIIKTGMIFSLILAYFMLNEKMTNSKILLSVLLFIGAYLISTGGKTLIPNTGDIFIVVCAFFHSLANVLVKKLDGNVQPDIISAFRAPIAVIVLFFTALIMNQNVFILKEPIIVFASSISTVLLMIMLNRGIHATSISLVTMLSMITPVIVAILGLVFLGEIMNSFHILGAIIIILSGILISRTNIHKH